MILLTLIDMYSLIVLAAVVMSWIGVSRGNPIAEIIIKVTEPVLDPIRRVLPPVAGLDFSPMVLLVALRLLRGVAARAMF
jgi:YggT family protein